MNYILAVMGDTHTNSKVGLSHPDFTPLNDIQKWLWDNYTRYLEHIANYAKQENAKVVGVVLGDALDNNSHAPTGLISLNRAEIVWQAQQVLKPFQDVCDDMHMISGTEAHTGDEAELELILARALGLEEPAQELNLNINGCYTTFTHHGRIGGRAWTKENALVSKAYELALVKRLNGERVPDWYIHGHVHQYAESGTSTPVRVISNACWQWKTPFSYRIAVTNPPSIGGLIVVLRDDGFRALMPYLANITNNTGVRSPLYTYD